MAERMGRLPKTPIRYAYKAPDGTIPYFSASDGEQWSGRLSAGANPKMLLDNGFTFVDRDTFIATQQATNPRYRAEQMDVDELARAFDASEGVLSAAEGTDGEALRTPPNGQQDASQGADMNGQMDPQMMEILQQYAQEGRLDELFQPYQQEQSVLDQQMQIAQGMRERGPQRGTPTGALFGGLSNALGNIGGAMLQKKALEGQTALGKRQQAEASGRVSAILREMQRRKGIDPSTGMMAPAVDDATLASMFSEGM